MTSHRFVKILHIDQSYQVFYWVLQEGSRIFSTVPIKQAIALLNSTEFDLIISEPQNLAVLKKSQPECH